MGLMQLMPATAKQYGVRNAFSPAENVRAGVAYLRELLNRYQNNEELALAAYNAGPGAVDKHGQTVPPYRETQNYVTRINGMAARPRHTARQVDLQGDRNNRRRPPGRPLHRQKAHDRIIRRRRPSVTTNVERRALNGERRTTNHEPQPSIIRPVRPRAHRAARTPGRSPRSPAALPSPQSPRRPGMQARVPPLPRRSSAARTRRYPRRSSRAAG